MKKLVISPNRDSPENGTQISLVSKCTRCLVRPDNGMTTTAHQHTESSCSQLPNVDPSTGVRDKAVPYKVLMKFRRGKDPDRPGKACFGCNGVPEGCGVIRVGDFVHVREWAGPGGV